MIAYDPFVAVFGSVPPGDEESLVKVVASAVRNGFAIVLDRPGTKIPLCILNTRDRKTADTAAKEAARQIGDPRWDRREHACGIHHAMTVESLGGDPKTVLTKAGNIIRRVTKEHGGLPNIGVEVGRSRLLVVDVDTQDERMGFEDDFLLNGPPDRTDTMPPGLTVQSPGRQQVDGTWVHKDGGHYWFTVPAGVTLPEGTGTYRAPSGWVAMWSGHQVLVPPSRRPEGDYLLVGQLNEAPAWLTDTLAAAAYARMERASARSGPLPDGSGDIDRWAAELPWADLLEPDDWTDTGLPDRCSCPIWTAPGPHASPKSATAHDVGCDRYDVAVGHAPLHVWTDNPPAFLDDAHRATGSRTFTKLQYVAWRDHAGDVAAALGALGMTSSASVEGVSFDVPESWTPTGFTHMVNGTPTRLERQDTFSQPAAADEDDADPEPSPERPEPIGEGRVLGSLLDANDLESIPPPEPLIAGVLDVNTIGVLSGKFGTYKTFLALAWAASVATGKPWQGHEVPEAVPVLYVAAEGASGLRGRLKAWTKTHGAIPRGMLSIVPVAARLTEADEVRQLDDAIRATGARLLVLDTLHKVTPGMDEDSAKEMGKALHLVNLIRERNAVTVLLIHHTGHNGTRARGSSSLEDDVDSAFVIKLGGDGEDRGPDTPRVLMHRKSKDAELLGSMDLRLVAVDGTGSCVVDADPFDRKPAVEVAPGRGGETSPELEGKVLDALDGTLGRLGLPTPEIVSEVGGRKANILATLFRLTELGLVEAHKDGRSKRWAITESGHHHDSGTVPGTSSASVPM